MIVRIAEDIHEVANGQFHSFEVQQPKCSIRLIIDHIIKQEDRPWEL